MHGSANWQPERVGCTSKGVNRGSTCWAAMPKPYCLAMDSPNDRTPITMELCDLQPAPSITVVNQSMSWVCLSSKERTSQGELCGPQLTPAIKHNINSHKVLPEIDLSVENAHFMSRFFAHLQLSEASTIYFFQHALDLTPTVEKQLAATSQEMSSSKFHRTNFLTPFTALV